MAPLEPRRRHRGGRLERGGDRRRRRDEAAADVDESARLVDLATGEPAQALVERSDVAAVEALAVVAEAAVAWELARAGREKFGGDALADLHARRSRGLPGAATHSKQVATSP